MQICKWSPAAYIRSAAPANANARFLNFLSDCMAPKSAWDEDRTGRLDWRDEEIVTSEET